jgi:hypothetical protein
MNSSAAESVTVRVATTANASTANSIPPPFLFHPKMRRWLPMSLAGFLLAMVVAPVERKRSRARLYACALAIGLTVTAAVTVSCGGGSSTPVIPPGNNGTPPGSYSVTVYAFTESNVSNGANGNADASVAIPLTVN